MALAAGGDYNLALGANGHIYAWGNNQQGQLGDGTTATQLSPEDISVLPSSALAGVSVVGVAACVQLSLAVGSNGHVYAWGANSYGQLGDGTTATQLSPEDISILPGSALGGVTIGLVGAGQTHSLAVAVDNSVGGGSGGGGGGGGGTTTPELPSGLLLGLAIAGLAWVVAYRRRRRL